MHLHRQPCIERAEDRDDDQQDRDLGAGGDRGREDVDEAERDLEDAQISGLRE